MSTQRAYASGSLSEGLGLGAIVLALAAASGLVAYTMSPLYVPLMVLALLGGALVLWQPAIGVFTMFSMVLFKPEAIQGLGLLGPNALISLALGAILFTNIMLGGPSDFLRSNQIRAFVLLGALLVLNWVVVGRVEAPPALSGLDHTVRILYRHMFQLVMLVFVIAFVRTKRQLLVFTGLFLAGVLLTIPGALTSASDTATKVEALRAAAMGGVQAAENANRLAFISLMSISILWFALQHYRSALVRLAGGLTILVLILTVFRSGSRSGVLNLILLGALLLFQSRMNPGNVGVIVIVAMLGLFAVIMLVPDAVMQRILSVVVTPEVQPKSLAESNVRRLAVLVAGVRLALDNPIMGVGIGNFRWMTTFDIDSGGISMAAHNAYLLALAEGGVILLGGYFLLFWLTARDLGRTLRQSVQRPEVGLGWLVLATRTNLILLLVFSLFAEAWKEFFFLFILQSAGILTRIYAQEAGKRARV